MTDRPQFSPRLVQWFTLYLDRYCARHFTAVRLSRSGFDPGAERGPLVVYSNHPSWWDPILYFVLGGAVFPGREGYGPMDAAALAKYGIFRRMGVFGVERGSRAGAARFLRTARWVLAREGAVLWITAEGEFTDARTRPVSLAAGVAHLARSVEPLTLVPLAIEYPFWDERLPEALARFGEPLRTDRHPATSTDAWRRRLERGLEANLDRLADEARRRDPSLFETLVAGRTGVGGIYDGWRRLRARVRGRRFVASHGDGEGR
jgi:1-acyl-sn-glycerol-3-phosphate acyltransferase